MIERKLVKVEGQKIVVSADIKVDESIFKKYHWLCKWDIKYKTTLKMTSTEKKLAERFNRIVKRRPSNNDRLDQYYSTSETNVKRLRLLEREAIFRKKTLCFLGDDDLTSLMVAIKNVFSEIVVYDIDYRIINFINEISQKYRLGKYKGVFYDYRQVPIESKKFDIFHSDPPATIEAVDLVLKRARELATPSATFYLSWPEYICDPEYLIGLQMTYAKNGWLVTGKFPEFNEYDNKCFFNYITDRDRETLKLFNLNDCDIINSPPIQRYCLTRLLLVTGTGIKTGQCNNEIYLSNLHKISAGKF